MSGRPANAGILKTMCRNIRPLFHFDPATTDDEMRDAATQFVRKVSGFTKPSQANEAAFTQAVDEITAATKKLLGALETNAPLRHREQFHVHPHDHHH